jgi:hypothetical protein
MVAECNDQFSQFWTKAAAEMADINKQLALQANNHYKEMALNCAKIKDSENVVSDLRQQIQVELEKMRMLNDVNTVA